MTATQCLQLQLPAAVELLQVALLGALRELAGAKGELPSQGGKVRRQLVSLLWRPGPATLTERLGQLQLKGLELSRPLPAEGAIHQQPDSLAPGQGLKPAQVCRLEGQIQAVNQMITVLERLRPLPGAGGGWQWVAAVQPQGQGKGAAL